MAMNIVNYQEDSTTGKIVRQKSIAGAALTHIKGSDISVYGGVLHFGLYGDISVPQSLTGSITLITTVSEYDKITLGLLNASGVNTSAVGCQWSQDGTAANAYPATPTVAWAAAAGNQGVQFQRLDDFIHVTITMSVSQAIYAYLAGRNLG